MAGTDCSMAHRDASSFASRGITVCGSSERVNSRGTNADRSTIVFSGKATASLGLAAPGIGSNLGRQYNNSGREMQAQLEG
jgi:hypothetical protein